MWIFDVCLFVNRFWKLPPALEEPNTNCQVTQKIRLGSDGDFTIVDMNKERTIDPKKLHSKNPPTPWGGWKVKGMPVYTVVRGNVQMKDGEPVGKVIGQMQTPIIN